MTDAREGSLDAPFRHALDWQNPDFYDIPKVEAELERVFDICHGCRRCFNLCDSFPRLFDMIDASPTEELDGVPKSKYAEVTEACTLCDMCFMTKCPYVPPHPFNVDFPHVLLRHRAALRKTEGGEFVREQLGETDRNGKLAKPLAPLVNWATDLKNKPVRAAMEAVAGIDKTALLPTYHAKTAGDLLKKGAAPDPAGPAFGQRKVALYATCFVEYNTPSTATAAAAVLAKQGVETRFAYPACCGMPELEAGNIAEVAKAAKEVCAKLLPLVDEGYDIVTLTASCGLMMKFEWPLILPDNADVKRLAAATKDISQYVVELNKQYGIAPGPDRAGGRRHRPPRLPRARAEHGRGLGPDAEADPRRQGRSGRALLRPRWHLRCDEGDARHSDQGRQAGRPPGRGQGQRHPVLRLSAGVQTPRSAGRNGPEGRPGRSPSGPPHRSSCPSL